MGCHHDRPAGACRERGGAARGSRCSGNSRSGWKPRRRGPSLARTREWSGPTLDLGGDPCRSSWDGGRARTADATHEGRPDHRPPTPTWACGVSCRACWGVQSTASCRPECATATSPRRSRPAATRQTTCRRVAARIIEPRSQPRSAVGPEGRRTCPLVRPRRTAGVGPIECGGPCEPRASRRSPRRR